MENEEALQNLLEEWTGRYPVDEVIQRVQDAISKKKGRAAAVVTGKVSQPAGSAPGAELVGPGRVSRN